LSFTIGKSEPVLQKLFVPSALQPIINADDKIVIALNKVNFFMKVSPEKILFKGGMGKW
jgi:hypothetical protein